MRIKFTLLCLALTFTLLLKAQDKYGDITFNKAVNISGKQRMLGQRMSKAYIYLLNNPTNVKAKNELRTSSAIFNKHNQILSKYASSRETSKKIKKVNRLWDKIKPIVSNTPTLTDAKYILEHNSDLLKRSDNVVTSIIADAGSTSDVLPKNKVDENMKLKETINISGRQRMLSQRLALYYFSGTNELNSKESKEELKKTYDKFDEGLTTLMLSDFNTQKIEDLLDVATRDWEELKKQEDEFFRYRLSPLEIYKKTNNLMTTFNKLTTLYEKVTL